MHLYTCSVHSIQIHRKVVHMTHVHIHDSCRHVKPKTTHFGKPFRSVTKCISYHVALCTVSQTDRQKDRQTDKNIDRQTERQIDR